MCKGSLLVFMRSTSAHVSTSSIPVFHRVVSASLYVPSRAGSVEFMQAAPLCRLASRFEYQDRHLAHAHSVQLGAKFGIQ